MRRKADFELIEMQGGKYAIVMGVTRRAEQLNSGARPLVARKTLNNVDTAIEELAEGRIRVIPPEKPVRQSPLRRIPQEILDQLDGSLTASAAEPTAKEPETDEASDSNGDAQ